METKKEESTKVPLWCDILFIGLLLLWLYLFFDVMTEVFMKIFY